MTVDDPTRTTGSEGLPGGPRTVIAIAVVLAMAWPVLFASHFGSVSALLLAARGGPTSPVIAHDFPDARWFPPPGHDGQQFYAVARDPFHPKATARHLDPPERRYRRILFPLLAWLIAPGNGAPLVIALAAVSVVGVLVGAIALSRFPDGPWWLPLSLPLSPGIMVSLSLSLSDALATGLVLAAYAAAFRRRWRWAVVVLVLAVLTRETTLVAAVCLACWPRVNWRTRAAVAGVPALVLAAWSAVASALVGDRQSGAGSGEFALPFTGWLHGVSHADLAVPALLTVVLVLAACRPRVIAPVRLYLVATVGLMICLGPVINFSWVNSARVLAPALPMAIWVLVRVQEHSADDA